jgi:hypothetical protein
MRRATPDRRYDDELDRQMILITSTTRERRARLAIAGMAPGRGHDLGQADPTKAVNEGERKPRQLSQAVDL